MVIVPVTSLAGRTKGLPSCPHLIIVPPNLIEQWKSELHRFLKPGAAEVIVMPTAQKMWVNAVKAIQTSKQPPEQIIVLITHQVCIQFADIWQL